MGRGRRDGDVLFADIEVPPSGGRPIRTRCALIWPPMMRSLTPCQGRGPASETHSTTPPLAGCGSSLVQESAPLRTRRNVCSANPATPSQYAGSRERDLTHHRVSKPTRTALSTCCRGAIGVAPWRVRGRARRRTGLQRVTERRLPGPFGSDMPSPWDAYLSRLSPVARTDLRQ